MFFVLNQPYKIFDEVPEVENDQSKLNLLFQVNAFMIDQETTGRFSFQQNERKKGHSVHPEERDSEDKAFGDHRGRGLSASAIGGRLSAFSY